MPPIFIIAEAGVNHNGDIKTALRMINAAKECGADAIKFQTFNPESLVSRFAPKAEYQKKRTKTSESQHDMLAKLMLSEADHWRLLRECKRIKIAFMSSPFDFESIELIEKLGLGTFKIPSGEITNFPFLEKIGCRNKPILLSTGMADLQEVRNAITILTRAGTSRRNITLLHCTTEYPAPFESVNLRAIDTLRKSFDLNVGYSDHTSGIEVAIAAAALGATVIEKHFTLNKKMKGPDHSASLEPQELKQLVVSVRNIEKALGDGIKRPIGAERANLRIVRKSIVALKNIKKGDFYSETNIGVKRPGNGISPMKWKRVLGKKAPREFQPDEMISL